MNYGGKIIQGVNDIKTIAPWMVCFLKNKEESQKYAAQSGKKIIFKCPDCNYETEHRIQDVYKKGFSCPICGDKISRPNKFARNVLLQLPITSLRFEYQDDWTMGKRFDNYFEYNDNEYVLEMDGDQHFTDTVWSERKIQEQNDLLKNQIARKNDIRIIRIKAEYGKYNQWIDNFYNSEIGDLIKTSNIDWEKCIEKTERSFVKEICDFYNENGEPSTEIIANHFKINRHIVVKYLKSGARIGFCNYNAKKTQKQKMDKLRSLRLKDSRKIRVEDLSHNLVGIYDRIEVCKKELEKLFPNKKFSTSGIIRSCTLYEKSYNELFFSYEGVDKIETYYKNNETFQKVCKCYAENGNCLFANEIKDRLKIKTDRTVILSYLKVGTLLGLCDYSSERNEIRRIKTTSDVLRCRKSSGVKVIVYKNKIKIQDFLSIRDAVKKLNILYPNMKFLEKNLYKNKRKYKEKYPNTNTFCYKGFCFEVI